MSDIRPRCTEGHAICPADLDRWDSLRADNERLREALTAALDRLEETAPGIIDRPLFNLIRAALASPPTVTTQTNESAVVWLQANPAPVCPHCGQMYVSCTGMGIYHVCPKLSEATTGTPD